MPYPEWYWDHFDPDVIEGDLNFSDEQTTGLKDLSDKHRFNYETQFIDEVYGTEDRAWETNRGEALPDTGPTQQLYSGTGWNENKAEIRYMGQSRRGQDPTEHVLWGLDLRRVDNEALKPGTDEHYQHMTRGAVDWASYTKDPMYQRAFKEMREDRHETVHTRYDISFLLESSQGRGGTSDREKIDFIRAAADRIGEFKGSDEDAEPEGEYDAGRVTSDVDADGNRQLYIEGQRQQTLSELYNATDADGFKKGRLNVGFTYTRKDEDGNNVQVTVGEKGQLGPESGAFDPVAGPPTPVIKPNIKVPDIKVKVPDSLKQWKHLAKQTLKVGGKK